MKIAIASDVHLEFGPLQLENTESADVLVLSGDICTAKDLDYSGAMYGTLPNSDRAFRMHDFFKQASQKFKHVIYVIGNHEHYNYDFPYTFKKIKDELAQYENIYMLDRECKVIDDVTFVGGTMWTDMNKRDPLTLHAISRMMNDFRCVTNSKIGRAHV